MIAPGILWNILILESEYILIVIQNPNLDAEQ